MSNHSSPPCVCKCACSNMVRDKQPALAQVVQSAQHSKPRPLSLCSLPGEPPPHPMLQQTDQIPLFLPSCFKEETGIAASKRSNAYMEVNTNHIKCLGPGHSLTACFSVTRSNLPRPHNMMQRNGEGCC